MVTRFSLLQLYFSFFITDLSFVLFLNLIWWDSILAENTGNTDTDASCQKYRWLGKSICDIRYTDIKKHAYKTA